MQDVDIISLSVGIINMETEYIVMFILGII